MRNSIVILLAVSAVSAKNVCSPGSSSNSDCKTCKCSDDDKTAICTDNICPELSDNMIPQQVCKPRSVFKDYCNTCFCSLDGTRYACTRMSCSETLWNKDGTIKVPADNSNEIERSNQVCKPGSVFKEYCNLCFCGQDGTAYACTKMLCDRKIWNKDGSKKIDTQAVSTSSSASRKYCTPGTAFKSYCNMCSCSLDGRDAGCTRMGCPREIYNEDGSYTDAFFKKSGMECNPGTVWSPDGCNSCVCPQSGEEPVCTAEICHPTLHPFLEKEKKWGPIYHQGDECTPETAFYSACNQCVCTHTGRNAVCTMRRCH